MLGKRFVCAALSLILVATIGAQETEDLPQGSYTSSVHRLRLYQLSEPEEGELPRAQVSSNVLILDELEYGGETREAVGPDGSVGSYSQVFVESLQAQGWVGSEWLIPGGIPAVVVSDAPVFDLPLSQAVGTRYLSAGTVVLIHDEPTADPRFVRVSGWDENLNRSVRSLLVQRNFLTSETVDVQTAARLIAVSYGENDEQKRILIDLPLASGLDPRSSEFFGDQYQSLVNRLNGIIPQSERPEVPFFTDPFFLPRNPVVAPSGTVLRDWPSQRSGQILEELEAGTPLVVTGASFITYRVDGTDGRWYRVTDPAPGWVHGSGVQDEL